MCAQPLLALLLLGAAVAQPWNMGVPSRPVAGFRYGGTNTTEPLIVISQFLDLLCADSKAADVGLTQAIDELGRRVALEYHLFPLPYHRNGFLTSQAAFVVANTSGLAAFTAFKDEFYSGCGGVGCQQRYWNVAANGSAGPLISLPQAQTTAEVRKVAARAAPALTDAEWRHGMSGHGGTAADHATRALWKYGASKAVVGTPATFVNGVAMQPFEACVCGAPDGCMANASVPAPTCVDDVKFWDKAKWISFLKPMLAARRSEL